MFIMLVGPLIPSQPEDVVLRRQHVGQESLANAKVSARQQWVYEDPSEEIYSKFAIDG